MKNISKVIRNNTALIFTGNHHPLRASSALLTDADTFLENVFFHTPLPNHEIAQIYQEASISRRFKLNNSELKHLISLSAGNPAIIKGLARYLNSAKQKPKSFSTESLINNNEIMARLEYIAKSFNKDELNVIESLMNKEKQDISNPNYQLLKNIGFINEDDQVFSPLVKTYLESKYFTRPSTIFIQDGQIKISDQPSNHLFTASEFVLLSHLLLNKMKIISRDELFDAIWQEDIEKYSDWNLDQLVRRVRKKLKPYNLSKNLLTIKGRGLMWYEQSDRD